jgi:AAA15 family ATPase/GTPase
MRPDLTEAEPVPARMGGYQMIETFEIKHFRCFKSLKLPAIKRFNFIVGESGTGKTAFLEALFLVAGGNPEIWFRLRRWRGLGEGPMQFMVKENYEVLFRDLFYRFNQKQGAFIKIIDTEEGKRELEIFYKHSETYTLPVQPRPRNAFVIDPITFKWDTRNKVTHSEVIFEDQSLKMTGNVSVLPVYLISPQTFSPRENSNQFSLLSRAKKEEPVLSALQSIFKEVQGISLEILAGEPVLHVAVEGLDEKMPLGDLSGGVTKYISIILAILSNPGGVVLIDEIEDGFYYKNLPDLLHNIVYLCDTHNVQLFATTHSYEFLQAMAQAIPAAKRGADDFSLLRFGRGVEQPELTRITGESYEAAIKESFEIR